MIKTEFNVPEEIKNLYAPVFMCPNLECNDHHALNYPNHDKCYLPRDFFGYYQKPKKIMVIGMNPGKILKRETREYKKIHQSQGTVTLIEAKQLVVKHLELSAEMFEKGMHIQENKIRIAFHKDFPEAVSKILRVEKAEIFRYIYYSNMVKCQTNPSFTKLRLDDRTYLVEQCFKRHLLREIQYLKPKLILTYGRIVYDSLPWRDLIPIKVFNIPRIWAEASADQRKQWRDRIDVVSNNLSSIIADLKENHYKN